MFKDILKSVETGKIKIPAIKGHTKIELTNIYTGRKEKIEHDNTFQGSFIAAYMRSLGAYNNNPYSNSGFTAQTVLKNLLGGILLFKDSIQVGTEYMPAGNEMVANGAMDISNAATPTELGSYNSIESVINGDSATLVYDWNTAQGNGEISTVCLTSYVGGLMGYGNKSGGLYASPVSMIANQSSAGIGNYVTHGNIAYSFAIDNTNKKLTVTKRRITVTKVSIFDNNVIGSVELSYPTALRQTAKVLAGYIGNNKILIHTMPSNNSDGINNNETYYFLVYDCSNDTLTEGKIINTTGKWLSLSAYYYPYSTNYYLGCNIAIIGNYVYCSEISSSSWTWTGNTIYKFNWTTGALEETYTLTKPLYYRGNSAYIGNIIAPICEGIYAYMAADCLVIHDIVNNTFYPSNASGNQNAFTYNDSVDALTTGLTAATSQAYKSPLYLATINNLDSPVTKTAAKTMKVTYTLTLAE